MDDRTQRREARLPLEIRVEYKRLNAFIADYTRDISSGGLFIRSPHPLPVGTECLFTLSIPQVETALSFRGVVRRTVEPGEDADGDLDVGMGVELQFDDDEEKEALKRLVEGLMVDHLGEALYLRLARAREGH